MHKNGLVPLVSVVIPAYNEEKYICSTLSSLLESVKKTDLNFEVILIDNNSSDDTTKVAQKFNKDLNLRIIRETVQGRGAARARGFREAKGRIILSADADTLFDEDWINTLVKGLENGAGAIATSCKIVDCSSLTNAMFNFMQPKLAVLYRIFFGHYWLGGFSFSITRPLYEASGGFDSTLQTLEDVDLSFKVSRLGKIKFINKPVIFSGRRFQKSLFLGMLQYVKTFIQAFILKNKQIYMDNPR